VADFFFITPTVFFGGAYIDAAYTSRNQLTMIDTEKAARGVEPMLGVSLSLDFTLADNFFIGINAGYGMFFETTRVIQFVSCGINLGVRF
jgi:hypothetical protein